ncbi:NAD(P)/FAD-dependent oxidoreductase [Cohnella sp. REN36]|uniref:FAD-dependent monooxygenase n=1 Tax=Cohnella sp. REN36 TaxID=2887347 RepID=UPI001D15CF1E|nr:NAD(P)/FAD-dependent oxidoreductase [Cohnella sp. REN36]MCC3371715.1 NAD(P)/FAD-dependent oxidoreductase [Cohnella sp. REN36]
MTDRAKDYDAIVVGAGIAGSGMAAALAGQGWRTLLLDRGRLPQHKACGEFLSPESADSLAWLGCEGLAERLGAVPITRVRLLASGGAELSFSLRSPAQGISRFALDEALREDAAAKGADIRAGVTVREIRPLPEGGWAVETDGEDGPASLLARAAFGAWGRQRAPGRPASLRQDGREGSVSVRGRAPGRIGRKTQLEGVPLTDAVELYLFDGGYAGVAPVEGGRTNVAAVLDARLGRSGALRGSEWLEAVAARHPPLADRLAGGRPVTGSDSSAAPIRPSRDPVAWGAVPHIGDAAIVVPPLCGDGMAMALRSVRLCAPLADAYLRGAVSLDGWRDAYARALRREFRAPARRGGLLQAALLQPRLAAALLRAGALAPGIAAQLFHATRVGEAPPPR